MQQQRQHMIRASDMYRKYVPGVYQRQQYLPRAVSSPIVCGLNICDQYPRYTHVSVVVIVRLPRSRRCVGGAVEPLKRSRQSCTAHNACVRFVIGLRTSTHVWVQQQYHIYYRCTYEYGGPYCCNSPWAVCRARSTLDSSTPDLNTSPQCC